MRAEGEGELRVICRHQSPCNRGCIADNTVTKGADLGAAGQRGTILFFARLRHLGSRRDSRDQENLGGGHGNRRLGCDLAIRTSFARKEPAHFKAPSLFPEQLSLPWTYRVPPRPTYFQERLHHQPSNRVLRCHLASRQTGRQLLHSIRPRARDSRAAHSLKKI